MTPKAQVETYIMDMDEGWGFTIDQVLLALKPYGNEWPRTRNGRVQLVGRVIKTLIKFGYIHHSWGKRPKVYKRGLPAPDLEESTSTTSYVAEESQSDSTLDLISTGQALVAYIESLKCKIEDLESTNKSLAADCRQLTELLTKERRIVATLKDRLNGLCGQTQSGRVSLSDLDKFRSKLPPSKKETECETNNS